MKFTVPLWFKLFLLLIFLILASVIFSNDKKVQNDQLPADNSRIWENTIKKPDEFGQEMNLLIEKFIGENEGRYSIFIKNLDTGHSYFYNKDEKFRTASIYKLAVMYKAYDEIGAGRLKKSDILSSVNSQASEDSQNSNTESASLTVDLALRYMITISDNHSAQLLAEKFGWQNVDNLMTRQNLGGFDLYGPNSPQTTAQATGNLLEQIYTGVAVSKQASYDMNDLLLGQKINDRIPKYLPKEVRVAHKTGELEGLRHDAGIVYGKRADYIFVFLSETVSPIKAAEAIAILSRDVFNVFEND